MPAFHFTLSCTPHFISLSFQFDCDAHLCPLHVLQRAGDLTQSVCADVHSQLQQAQHSLSQLQQQMQSEQHDSHLPQFVMQHADNVILSVHADVSSQLQQAQHSLSQLQLQLQSTQQESHLLSVRLDAAMRARQEAQDHSFKAAGVTCQQQSFASPSNVMEMG